MLVTHMRKGVPKKMKRTTKKKEKRRKSINTGMILAFFGALMAGVPGVLEDAYNNYHDSHPSYKYEMRQDWMHMDEAASVSSNKSVVEVYKDNWQAEYWCGAELVTLYHNLSKQDRVISKFRVYAENIEENYEAKIKYRVEPSYNQVPIGMENYGWGSTGKITIALDDLSPENPNEDRVELEFKEGAAKEWCFESIEPGESVQCACLPLDSLKIICKETLDEPVAYIAKFNIEMENGEPHKQECGLRVYPDRIEVNGSDVKGCGAKEYVICVDTAESSWSREFYTTQILPAGETVRLPICIVPKMSCTMSVRIEFETMDGEVIQAEPLDHAVFTVPYYEGNMERYIDGLKLDWEDGDSNKIVYFPFEKVTAILPPK